MNNSTKISIFYAIYLRSVQKKRLFLLFLKRFIQLRRKIAQSIPNFASRFGRKRIRIELNYEAPLITKDV